jgi:hypothetical protein
MGEAVDRNFQRWQVLGEYVWPNDYVGQSYQDEINFLKNWLVARLEWMDDNMVGDCNLYTSDSNPPDVASVKVFPNPTSNFLFLENLPSIKGDAFIEVFDIQGKRLLSQKLNNLSNIIATEALSNGFYILTVKEDGQIIGRTTFIKHGVD